MTWTADFAPDTGHVTVAGSNQGGHVQPAEGTVIADRFRKLIASVWNAGLPVIDDLHASSYDWKEGSKSSRFIELLKQLQPGITMVIVHCSRPTEEFPLITGARWNDNGEPGCALPPRGGPAS